MFLVGDIQGALEAIKSTIQQALGPLANLNSLTASDFEQYGIDFGIQLAATIILFIIVAIFFWKPITKILEQRREAIDKELEDAKAAKENAIEIESELRKERDDAKAEIKSKLDQAEKEANLKRDMIINQAREEAKRRMENLELEFEQEKKSMEADIRKEIVDIAFKAAEKIVAKEINQEKYLDVVDEILKGASE